MTGRRRPISPPLIALGAILAALALAVRAVVPAGFMPMAGSGVPTLVICTGQGPMTVAMPAELAMSGMGEAGGDQGDHDGHAGDHGCPFAAMAGAVALAAPPAVIPPPFVAATPAAVSPLHARPGLGLAAPPPPKTGPPLLA